VQLTHQRHELLGVHRPQRVGERAARDALDALDAQLLAEVPLALAARVERAQRAHGRVVKAQQQRHEQIVIVQQPVGMRGKPAQPAQVIVEHRRARSAQRVGDRGLRHPSRLSLTCHGRGVKQPGIDRAS
jgi:hypothetical protein